MKKIVTGAILLVELLISLAVVTAFSALVATSCWYITASQQEIKKRFMVVNNLYQVFIDKKDSVDYDTTYQYKTHTVVPQVHIHDTTILAITAREYTVHTATAQWCQSLGGTARVSLLFGEL